MNKYKLISTSIALSLGLTSYVVPSARTISIKNGDYNSVITNVVSFTADNKDNNAIAMGCTKDDIIKPGQDCLIQYSSKAKAVITFKVKSKQQQHNNSGGNAPTPDYAPDSDLEVYSVPDGTVINKYPSYFGPQNGSDADYQNEKNYATTSTSFNYKPNGGISNPNRNDVIEISSM